MTATRQPVSIHRTAMAVIAAFFVATLTVAARAETPSAPEKPASQGTACEPTKALTSSDLHGSWQVTWETTPPTTDWLRLRPNPEFADSVIGETQRNNARLQLAGDIDDDQLTLEESRDGKSIAATWVAPLTQTAASRPCALTLKGLWTPELGATNLPPDQTRERRFTLRKLQGW